MWKKILVGLLLVIVVLVVVIALQPAGFQVDRSATIKAPPAVVFQQVNDLHAWQAWSPWAKKDPNAKVSYAGPTTGEGSSFTWDGNSDVGSGTMTIVESKPGERIKFRLDFKKPMEGTNFAEFQFAGQGEQTVVKWSMSCNKNFVSKAFGLFVDIEKMCGDDFEKGLAALKDVSEKSAKPSGGGTGL